MRALLLSFLFAFLICDANAQTATNIDSLWRVFNNTHANDTARFRAIGEVAKYEMVHNPDSALLTTAREDSLASILHYNLYRGQAAHISGIVYKNRGEYSRSVQSYLACLGFWTSIRNDSGVAMCHQTIANVYGRLHQTDKALMHYDSAITIFTRLNREEGIGSVFNDMGNMYLEINDTIALSYLRKSLVIRNKYNFEKGIAITSFNIASVLIKRGQADSALIYTQPYQAYAYKYHRVALMISGVTSIGTAYILKGETSRGRDSCLRALELNEGSQKNLSNEKFACECLTDAYTNLGDYQNALKYYKRAVAAKDSLNSQSQHDEVTRLEYQFEYTQKTAADSLKALQETEIFMARAEGEKNMRYALFAGLGLTLLFAGLMFNRFRITRRQRNLIAAQILETEEQKKVIEIKNKEITDSINYAQRIQQAILPSEQELKKAFTDIFVFFDPRDIVSGDFYWYDESPDNKVIAVADCTGHGVPGGFMSMLGFEILQDIVLLEEITTTSEALRRLDQKVTITLNKNDKSYRDGMDMALCAFPKNKMEMHYSGANRPLLHFSDGKMTVYKPDKHTIGGAIDDVKKEFSMHVIPLKQGDMIYMFSDGYADQFGGDHGKKFMSKKLEQLLISIASLSCTEQKTKLESVYRVWKGSLEQVDDICIIGIRI